MARWRTRAVRGYWVVRACAAVWGWRRTPRSPAVERLPQAADAVIVIDWGDMCRAPPSVDLPLYWSLFDADGRAAFRAAYGPLTDETLTRARVLALFFDATLAVYAYEKDMGDLQTEVLQGLTRTLIG